MLAQGHGIGGRLYEFPHVCPGPGCAIAAWLAQRDKDGAYRCAHATILTTTHEGDGDAHA